MKKRAMKKWIPNHTCYCYDHNGKCKWRVKRRHKPDEWDVEEDFYCLYTNSFDEGLLWDACKECGTHDTFKGDKINDIKYYKWRYRNRDRLAKRGW